MSFAPLFAMMGVVKKERRVGSALRGWGRRRGGKRAQKIRLTWWLYFSPLPVSTATWPIQSWTDARSTPLNTSPPSRTSSTTFSPLSLPFSLRPTVKLLDFSYPAFSFL